MKRGASVDKYDFFWKTMDLCDWSKEGDDELVLKPVIEYLSSKKDDDIFQFEDLMSELLYELDTKELADQCYEVDEYMCDDTFLYSRCVALINGRNYYEKAKKGQCRDMWGMEFEALLYVPLSAWSLKHNESMDNYLHISLFSYETGSNTDGWK